MKMIRACYAIYFVVLLIASALGTSLEGKGTTTPGLFLADEGVTDPPEIHEKVEWIHRRKELIEKGTTKDINFHIPRAESEVINSRLFTKRISDAANCLNGLPPRLREAIMSCLMENGVMFEALSSEISFEQLFLKCIHLISSWPASRRRLLLGDLSQELASGSASSISSLTVASSSQEALQKPAMLEPRPSHMTSLKINSSADALDDKFMIFNMISSVEYHEGSMSFPSIQPSEQPLRKRRLLLQETSEEEEVMEVIVVACAVTAIGTFVSVGLIFCCCVGGGEAISSGSSLRDEKPLLNMSVSDTSGGTSQMSNHLGSSSRKDSMAVDVLNNMSTEGSMTHNDLLTVEASSGDETKGGSLLPLPPGRSAPAPVPAPSPAPEPAPAPAPAPAPNPAPSPPPPGPSPPSGPRPPPPPNKGGRAPPMPPPRGARPSPPGPNRKGKDGASIAGEDEGENGAQKTKLKPFFWDKVLASDDHSMVWRTIQDGSFQLNEEMMENLFGYAVMENRDRKKTTVLESKPKFIQIIDPRKAQNLSILLKALNVTTEEVISALKQGNELPTELLQTLLKTQPTTDEELKLRLYSGELCDLGPAEQFLKLVVEIPSAFKRVEALLFMSSLQEEVINIKECFATLEVACNKLRNSRLFLKLLEAVLKTGNRMNDGTFRGGAQAIKLDTLLKLSDVKGTDGKTTLLLFVVQEIIRSEGMRALRAAKLNKTLSSVSTGDVVQDQNNPDMEDQYRDRGLKMISSLTDELQDVKKAAAVDTDTVATTVSKMRSALAKNSAFLNSEMKTDGEEDNEFSRALSNFVERADADVKWLAVEEERIMALVKSTADYFHGTAGTKEGLRLFVIVRDFLVMLDRICREVKDTRAKQLAKPVRKGAYTASTSSDKPTQASSLSSSENREPIEEMHKRLFPAIADRRQGGKGDWSSTSDSDSDRD